MCIAYEGNKNGPGVYRSLNGGTARTGLEIEVGDEEYLESAMAIGVDPVKDDTVYVVDRKS